MPDDTITLRMAVRIRKRRKQLRLSQERLAALCNLHRTYIGAIERGEKRITVVTLGKIARALHKQLPYFIR